MASPYLYESSDSRLIGQDKSTLTYIALGFENEFAAIDQLLVDVPDVLENGQVFVDWQLTNRYRNGTYRFKVDFESIEIGAAVAPRPDPLEEGEFSFSFDTTGRTERITQSFETKGYDATGRNVALDGLFGNAVNVTGVDKNMRVEGVDAVVPKLGFQIRAAIPNSLITIAYAEEVSNLTGRTNDRPFPSTTMPFVNQQFSANEVLFLGAVGSWNSKKQVEMTFHFDAGQTVTNLTTGDIINIIKTPHEFIWFRTEKSVDATAKTLRLKAKYAFVERIYEADNLDLLFPS